MMDRMVRNGRQSISSAAARSTGDTMRVAISTATPTAAATAGLPRRPMPVCGKDNTRPTVIMIVPYAIVSCNGVNS